MRWINSSSGFFRWISSALFLISYRPFHSPYSCISSSPGSAERACGASPWQRWPPCWCPAPLLGQWQRCCYWRLCCQSSSTTNLLEVVREEEKGVQHAFNIKMGKYSDRCEAEGILFSWRLWESLSSRRCYIYTRWDNDQERILKTIFFTVKSILEWGSWWTQLPLGWVQTGIFNFFSSSSGTSRRGESPQYCSTTFPYYSLLLSADTPCPSDYHFISCVPAEPRLVQGRGRRELS